MKYVLLKISFPTLAILNSISLCSSPHLKICLKSNIYVEILAKIKKNFNFNFINVTVGLSTYYEKNLKKFMSNLQIMQNFCQKLFSKIFIRN